MRTRNIILCFAVALSALPCFADPVGRSEALALAGRFLRAGGSRTGDAALRVSTLTPQTKSKDEPALYIVEDPSGGFVIVSNETSAVPVLGYSYTGSVGDVEDMPPALTEWLRSMEEAILEARNGKAKAAADVSRAWEEATIATKADGYSPVQPVVELETARWNQGYPFNVLCPEVEGGRAPTGCMPTATAIIMRYWKCPLHATGAYVEPYWQNDGGATWSADFTPPEGGGWALKGGWSLDYDYDWENMPLDYYSEGITETQVMAVATLMRDIGVMEKASYKAHSTGAAHEDGWVLTRYLGFDNAARHIRWDMFSNEDWICMITQDVLQGRPVLMSGFDNYTGGHAFVADGVDANNYVRMNWGWGGYMNGYYSLAPFGFENETRNPSFFFTMCAWIHLEPDKGTPLEPEMFVRQMTVKERRIYQGVPFCLSEVSFTLSNNPLSRTTEGRPNFYVAVAMYDKGGAMKELVSGTKRFFEIGDNVLSFDCNITSDIEIGDYISICYRFDENKPWREALHNVEDERGIVVLREEVPLSDVTSVFITREPHLEKYGAMFKDSRILRVTTRRGVSMELRDGSEKVLQRDNIVYAGKLFFVNGYFVIEGKKYWDVFLSDMAPGRYKIVLLGPLEECELSFEI